LSDNLSRYEDQLAKLEDDGLLLVTAMQFELYPEHMRAQLETQIGKQSDEYIKKIPSFSNEYQIWYSEAKAIIRQLIPDRLSDFVKHYERLPNRKIMQWDNYTIEDYLQGLSRGDTVPTKAGLSRMEQQLNILKAARKRLKSSLFDIRQLVAADLFDSELDAARSLAKSGFLRAAGAMTGVVLEKHMTQVCENHQIKVAKKHPTISDLNDILKNAEVIDTARWRATQYLGDIRNLCDHNKAKEPSREQIEELIDGATKLLKTVS